MSNEIEFRGGQKLYIDIADFGSAFPNLSPSFGRGTHLLKREDSGFGDVSVYRKEMWNQFKPPFKLELALSTTPDNKTARTSKPTMVVEIGDDDVKSGCSEHESFMDMLQRSYLTFNPRGDQFEASFDIATIPIHILSSSGAGGGGGVTKAAASGQVSAHWSIEANTIRYLMGRSETPSGDSGDRAELSIHLKTGDTGEKLTTLDGPNFDPNDLRVSDRRALSSPHTSTS